MQPLSLSTDVLTLDVDTSAVVLSPKPNDVSQVLMFDGEKLKNVLMRKFVSVNQGVVKADTDDSRGASSWTIGDYS